MCFSFAQQRYDIYVSDNIPIITYRIHVVNIILEWTPQQCKMKNPPTGHCRSALTGKWRMSVETQRATESWRRGACFKHGMFVDHNKHCSTKKSVRQTSLKLQTNPLKQKRWNRCRAPWGAPGLCQLEHRTCFSICTPPPVCVTRSSIVIQWLDDVSVFGHRHRNPVGLFWILPISGGGTD